MAGSSVGIQVGIVDKFVDRTLSAVEDIVAGGDRLTLGFFYRTFRENGSAVGVNEVVEHTDGSTVLEVEAESTVIVVESIVDQICGAGTTFRHVDTSLIRIVGSVAYESAVGDNHLLCTCKVNAGLIGGVVDGDADTLATVSHIVLVEGAVVDIKLAIHICGATLHNTSAARTAANGVVAFEVAVLNANHATARTDASTCRTGLIVDESAVFHIQLVAGEVDGAAEHIFHLTAVLEVDAAHCHLAAVGGTEDADSLAALVAGLLSTQQSSVVALNGADLIVAEVELTGHPEGGVLLKVYYGFFIRQYSGDSHLRVFKRLILGTGVFVATVGGYPVFSYGKRRRYTEHSRSG